jgi:hypothetical protein
MRHGHDDQSAHAGPLHGGRNRKRANGVENLMQTEPDIAFAVGKQNSPGLEIRVNFGVFSGRAATPAEIDRLAEWLLDEVGEVSIIAEERHEIDEQVEASVHQVRVEVADDRVPDNPEERDALERTLVARAEHWARACIAERHAEVAEL